MIKVSFWDLKGPSYLKENKGRDPEIFYDYTMVTDFITSIGKENVISINYFSRWQNHVSCAITYRDDELLTCPECSKEISNAFNFCPHCGARLN